MASLVFGLESVVRVRVMCVVSLAALGQEPFSAFGIQLTKHFIATECFKFCFGNFYPALLLLVLFVTNLVFSALISMPQAVEALS